jgi:hypothetical protein
MTMRDLELSSPGFYKGMEWVLERDYVASSKQVLQLEQCFKISNLDGYDELSPHMADHG